MFQLAKRFLKINIIFIMMVLLIMPSFCASQLYYRKYHGQALYDNEYCIKNNIDCYEILYRILCRKNEYYICEMNKNKYTDRPNFNLLDSSYKPIFESSFYSQFDVSDFADGDEWGSVDENISGSFSDENHTLYLGQDTLNFENDYEIIEYDLKNKKIVNKKTKKYSKKLNLPKGTEIIDTIDADDGRLYIVENEKGRAVLDESGEVKIGYCNNIVIDNDIYISYKEYEYSIKDIIFSINDNGKHYKQTIEGKKVEDKEYIHYLGYGYYHYGFEQEIGRDNAIYNLHNNAKLDNKASARYLELFRFKNKKYFYYFAPVYDDLTGFASIFDENGKEIDLYKDKNFRFVYLYTRKGEDIKEHEGHGITHIDDEYIYGFTNEKFCILDSDMHVVKELDGKYKKFQIYGEGKYQVYALTREFYGENITTDFYDVNLNLIKKDVIVRGLVTTENILNKNTNNHYLAISYGEDEYTEPRNEYIYVYDEKNQKYVLTEDEKLKMYDYEINNTKKGNKLYIRYKQFTQRFQQDRYNIYNEKGETLFENIIIFNRNLNIKNFRFLDVPKDYLVIYDDNYTKFLDYDFNVLKEFEGRKQLEFKGSYVNYLNDCYDAAGDKKYYILIKDDKYQLEKVIDKYLNIVADNKEDAEIFIRAMDNN